MQTLTVDVAVVGAGSAGLAAFRAAKSHHGRVLLIEGGVHGTTCARVGCMPSKLLIAAADAAHAMRQAPEFGVHPGQPKIDGRAVMRRVQAERDSFVGFVLDQVQGIPDSERVGGYARFVAPGRLQVGADLQVQATCIVLATGSHPNIPMPLRGLGEHLLTSDQVFELDDLPASAAVVGTGAIGLELGQALQRLGVRTALFGRGRGLAQLQDPQIEQAARRLLGEELDLRFETEILAAQREGAGVLLRWRAGGAEHSEHFERVLAAAGRSPNLERLDLQHSGLALDQHGVPLHDSHTMRCGDSAVFLAGDVRQERALLHEAAATGRIAGDNAGRWPDVQPGLRQAPLTIAFTDPQIASVGQGFAALPRGTYATGVISFHDQGRSRVMGQNRGLLHVYAERASQRLLGAEMIAPAAEHLAHLLAWACQAGMSLPQLLEMPYYHPVLEEGLRSALRDARERILHGLPEIERCGDSTPGM